MSEWISVKDRLPQHEDDVLIFYKNICSECSKIEDDEEDLINENFSIGRVIQNKWYINPTLPGEPLSHIVTFMVTHWMPLPEPPKCT